MNEGIIKDEKMKRQLLQQRITSHHKPLESENLTLNQNNNIIRFENQGPIIDILPLL